MKYYRFPNSYGVIPNSKINMSEALIKIGEYNPNKIRLEKYSFGYRKKVDKSVMSRKHRLTLGILNVKLKLNGHLGSSGKFTMRMIRMTASVKKDKKSKNTLIAVLPKDGYKEIVKATYTILYELDKKYCLQLFDRQKHDGLFTSGVCNRESLLTVAPVQTHCVISCRGVDEQREGFRKRIKNYAVKG